MKGRRRAPWWLRPPWRGRCRCRCHVPWATTYPDAESFFEWDGTPTHHDRACCARFVGTVNRGWGIRIGDYW